MDVKVKEFIDAAKAKEREARDKHLVSLGLVNEDESVRVYSATFNQNKGFVKYDKIKKKYYKYVKVVPLSVTDKEYEEIKKYSTSEVNDRENFESGAETALGVANLIVFIAISFISFINMAYSEGMLLVWLGVFLVGLISFFCIKVLLNISDNLCRINSKLK